MRALACPQCGAPIAPPSGAVRVTCSHCRATVDVTPDGVLKLAQALSAAGVRVAAKPMSMADIESDIAARERAAAATRRRTIVVTIVAMVLVAVGALLFLLATG